MNVLSREAQESRDAPEFDPRMLAAFVRRGVALPLAIFLFAFGLYVAAAAAAVLLTDTGWKIGLAALAGVFIANLAIIGHDAVHNSFTRLRWLNRAVGTLAFLPALHPYGRWEHHHNKVHHRYTAQLGVDNAYPPMTVQQYQGAPPARRVYYRFLRSLAGQPFFYLLDIWAPKMFLPGPAEASTFERSDWIDLGVTWAWLFAWIAALTFVDQPFAGGSFWAALGNAALYGTLIPFLVWNVFIAFVTIVQHTGPRVRWTMPTGRPSTFEQKLHGTVHMGFPEAIDWFYHRVMQHVAHHVNPVVPLYRLKSAEREIIKGSAVPAIVQTWTPLYHWRMTRDCKLYDPERDCWCDFQFQPTGARVAPSRIAASIR
jgi:omega-6 fatty acid desaturase (delta-12 desaturase)